jgi:hypothetical protein
MPVAGRQANVLAIEQIYKEEFLGFSAGAPCLQLVKIQTAP